MHKIVGKGRPRNFSALTSRKLAIRETDVKFRRAETYLGSPHSSVHGSSILGRRLAPVKSGEAEGLNTGGPPRGASVISHEQIRAYSSQMSIKNALFLWSSTDIFSVASR